MIDDHNVHLPTSIKLYGCVLSIFKFIFITNCTHLYYRNQTGIEQDRLILNQQLKFFSCVKWIFKSEQSDLRSMFVIAYGVKLHGYAATVNLHSTFI
jgi:hypothetical protein